jgi:hypothetical protein
MENEENTVPEPQATEPEKKPEPPSEIRLNAKEGSELHLSLAAFQLAQKEVENMNLKLEKAKAELGQMEQKRGRVVQTMYQKQTDFKKIMDRHGIPEGYSFYRQEDGTYLVRPPAGGGEALGTPPGVPPVPPKPEIPKPPTAAPTGGAPPQPPSAPPPPAAPTPPQPPAPPAAPGPTG